MANHNERRCSERATVMLSATVEQAADRAQVRLSNLSREGATVVGPALAQYSKVMLERDGRSVPSRVIWAEGSRSGLRFEQPTELESMLPRIARRRPASRAQPRRPGLRCAPLSEADRLVLERWATSGAALGD